MAPRISPGLAPLPWILLAAGLSLLPALFAPGLNDGEAMYAEIPREMRAAGDWITPRLNGTRHFDKPPLIYYLIGLGQALLGETEAAARLWPALATAATAAVVAGLGGALYGPRAGWLGALAFATSLGPHLFGRQVMPDPMLAFWIALALLGYARGFLGPAEGRGPWAWAMYAAMGLAGLTKGILGVGLPAAIIGLHALAGGRLRAFRSWRTAAGAAVVAAIVLPWHLAVAAANPDFLGYYVLREHVLRFTGQRYPPDEFLSLPVFLGLTFLWTFPWVAQVPMALGGGARRLARAGLRKGPDLLPLLWLAVVLGLFSASRSRLEYYSLPALPALALLLGKLWSDALDRGQARRLPRAAQAALGGLALLLAAGSAGALAVLGPAKDLVFSFVGASWPEAGWVGGPDQVATLERMRLPTAGALAAGALLVGAALAAARRGRPGVACSLLAGMMAPLFLLIHWGFLVVEPYQSSRALAALVRQAAGPGDPVVFQEPHEYMWVGGLTYYAKRTVHILKDPKFEGVGARRREPPDRFLDRQALVALWGSGRPVVVVAEERGDVPETLRMAGAGRLVGRAGGRVVLRSGAVAARGAPGGRDG